MTGNFEFLDYLIFIGYAVLILGVGLWVSRDKKGHQKNAEDYFLASKSLPWWAIGASLIAANISAEQFIGMSWRRGVRSESTFHPECLSAESSCKAQSILLIVWC